ncbi:MAG: choice-of-anchor B family protein, partial [Bacteroidota bacterium]
MKRHLLLFLCLSILSQVQAQLNAVLRDQLDYDSGVNDVWGYVAPDGTEYAIVGLVDGVSFVSLADPDNIVEVAAIPGQTTVWRDMKTFGEYAYIVADQATEGLTIVDLSDLQNGNVTWTHNNYELPNGNTLLDAHNIYVDTDKGYAILAGSNAATGVIYFDIASVPGEATFLTTVGNRYAHDTYMNNGFLYNSEINNGSLSIWDVNDIFNPVQLSSTISPFAFTHNAWSTANNNLVFTTDERADAPVAAYDISDPTNPVLLDEYRPLYSIGTGTIPHNTHVLDSFIITSYYTDGVTVVDASKPDNLIEVANWDTWSGGPGGFNGCWGAYPFLPSGLILASDRSSGLFVVDVEMQRAARLEGNITDAISGLPINGVDVSIQATQENEGMTNAMGDYRTGLANGGTYQVTYSHPDYEPLTLEAQLINGECVIVDTSLQILNGFSVTANVVQAEVLTGIADAEVLLINEVRSVSIFSDENGVADLAVIPADVYDIYVGKWGYQELLVESVDINGPTSLTFELELGYQDGFQLDLGWTTEASPGTSSGFWERDIPNGTSDGTNEIAPFFDADGDLGNRAYVTGNSDLNGGIGFDDIDDGQVVLTSPVFDLSIYQDTTVRLSYQYWFINFLGGDPGDDEFTVNISNGQEEVTLAVYNDGTPGQTWRLDEFNLSENITLTDQMQLTVIANDLGGGSISEAGFDDFLISGDLLSTSTENIFRAGVEALVFPNPSYGEFSFRYELPTSSEMLDMEITDVFGRKLINQRLPNSPNGIIRFGSELPTGTYFLRLLDSDGLMYSTKLIK